MTHNRYTLWAALLLPLLAGCQQEETPLTATTDPNAVVVEARLAAHQTRLSYGEDYNASWTQGDDIAINGGLTGATVVYSYDGTAWAPLYSDYLAWVDGANTFQAWRPIDRATYSSFLLPVYQSSTSALAYADWMTATKSYESKPSDGKLVLEFTHRLALVTVLIDDPAATAAGKTPTVSNASIALPSQIDENITADGTAVTPLRDGLTLHAILPPGTYTEGSNFLSLQVDDEEVTVSAPSQLTSPGLQAGKHYTFRLKVGEDLLSVSNVTVEDWTDQTLPGGAPVDISPKVDATNHTITLYESGWLTGNLIITAVGTNGNALSIIGPMNEEDLAALRSWFGEYTGSGIALDLSNVTELTGIYQPASSAEEMTADNNFTGVTSLKLPEGLRWIEDYAFYGNTTLAQITLPESLQQIESYAFYGTTALATLTLPEGVTKIESYAFANSSLATLTLPEGLEEIQNRAFYGTTKLTTLTLPESLKTIGEYALSESGLTAIKVPAGVTEVGRYAFEACPSLATATWQSDADIPEYAFNRCNSLQSVLITGEVKTIGNNAFADCDLGTVTLTTATPPVLRGDWIGVFVNNFPASVYVPYNAVQTYIDNGWLAVKADPNEGQH